MKKLMILAVLSAMLLSGCASSSNEPCIYCGDVPSKAYNANGHKSYVCDDCSSECFFCGDKATKKYVSLAGEMSFACKECFDSMRKD